MAAGRSAAPGTAASASPVASPSMSSPVASGSGPSGLHRRRCPPAPSSDGVAPILDPAGSSSAASASPVPACCAPPWSAYSPSSSRTAYTVSTETSRARGLQRCPDECDGNSCRRSVRNGRIRRQCPRRSQAPGLLPAAGQPRRSSGDAPPPFRNGSEHLGSLQRALAGDRRRGSRIACSSTMPSPSRSSGWSGFACARDHQGAGAAERQNCVRSRW